MAGKGRRMSEAEGAEPHGLMPPAVPAAAARGQVRAVAFDCYGTLLALEERQFAALIHAMLLGYGVRDTPGEQVWEAWLAASRRMSREDGHDYDDPLGGPEPAFRSFAERWPSYFAAAFAETGVEGIPAQEAFEHLWDEMSRSPAYPEALEVLDGLRANGYRTAIGSNADDGHLDPALAAAGIEVELVLSSERARSYKPRSPFFAQLCEELGLPPEQVLYVGDSPMADVTGANHFGMPVYWVKRYEDARRERNLRHEATWVFPDLRGLLEVLPKRS